MARTTSFKERRAVEQIQRWVIHRHSPVGQMSFMLLRKDTMKTYKKVFAHISGLFFFIIASTAQDGMQKHAGAPTNGVYAEICVTWTDHTGGRLKTPTFDVLVINTNLHGFYGEPEPKDQSVQSLSRRILKDKFLFYAPTNYFCGPMELRDAAGNTIRPVKPAVITTEAYPLSFSLKQVRNSNSHSNGIFPDPLRSTRRSLAQFGLLDNFDIKKSGVYTLKVWPKIYKRLTDRDDLCERVDVPPITVTIDVP